MIHTDNSDTLVAALKEIERLTKEIDGWKADQKENLANQVALQAEINERAEDAHANAILLESARAAGFRLQAERDAIKAANRDLQAWYDAALADAKRFEWALPILSGDDDSTANKRAITLGLLLAQDLTGRDAIDLAMKGEQP